MASPEPGSRQWRDLPTPQAPSDCETAPLARDLDLFVRASLFQLTCTASTPEGRATLARWLLQPAPTAEIVERQQAMRELSQLLDWRQEFEFRGAKDGGHFDDPAEFLAWAEGPGWLSDRPALSIYSVLAPLLLIGAAALQIIGWTANPWWGAILLANVAVTGFTMRHIHGIFTRVSTSEQPFERYALLMEWASRAAFQSPLLMRLQQRLQADHRDGATQLRALQRLVTLADLRFSSTVYGPVQALSMWNVHVLRGIESWQRGAGRHARDWLAALAEIEALASLAALAHAEPTWIDPTLHAEPVLTAKGLGHPLLSASRVANDVELGPPGSFLLVTGSNMSGKSTLLRSLGVNVILAQAGGPVCATSLQMPPLRVGASIRVQDSMEEATSLFMAELKRLKQVIDEASAGGATYLYLLDEILHGTNSHERRFAVRAVLERLLELRAIGAVSTHDLDLAVAPELAAAAQAVHFRETIIETPTGRKMTFDYHMRPGLATTTNALVLLEMVGLAVKHKD
jgi:DNA mismatch repair ATPase MutS